MKKKFEVVLKKLSQNKYKKKAKNSSHTNSDKSVTLLSQAEIEQEVAKISLAAEAYLNSQ